MKFLSTDTSTKHLELSCDPWDSCKQLAHKSDGLVHKSAISEKQPVHHKRVLFHDTFILVVYSMGRNGESINILMLWVVVKQLRALRLEQGLPHDKTQEISVE